MSGGLREAIREVTRLAYADTDGINLDGRLEALTMNLELAFRDIQEIKELARKDGKNISATARIA